MIPGIGSEKNLKDTTEKFKIFLSIIDSMTDQELDGDILIHSDRYHQLVLSRIRRIAKGSGTSIEDVHSLLK